MPKCPKCGAEIDYLIAYVTNVAEEDIFRVDKDGNAEYEEVDVDYWGVETSFSCPECRETLFTHEEDAKNFLKGEKVEVVKE